MDMKYIVYEGYLCQEIVIFPVFRDHRGFATQLQIREDDAVSAGFVSDDRLNHIRCYGRSTSLDVDSRPKKDTALLRRSLGWNEEDITNVG